MTETRDMRKKIKIGMLILAQAAMALILFCAGCGGGGGTLPHLPESALKSCSSTRVLGREAFATGTQAVTWGMPETSTSISCIQTIGYSQSMMQNQNWTYDANNMFPKSMQVYHGETVIFWAYLFNPICELISPDNDYTWSATGSIGSIVPNTQDPIYSSFNTYYTGFGTFGVFTAATGTQTLTGTVQVSYKGHTDSIAVTVSSAAASAGVSFAKKYGSPTVDEFGLDMVLASDGGYIMVGDSDSASKTDFMAVKADATGNQVWSKIYVNPLQNGEALSVVNASDGGYIIAGYSLDSWVSPTSVNAFLMKLSASNGSVVWTKTYTGLGRGRAFDLIRDPAGTGYFFAGSTSTSSGTNSAPWLVKTDSSGNIVWTQVYSSYPNSFVFAINTTSDNSIILGALDSQTLTSLRAIKVNSTGIEIWNSSITVPSGADFLSVFQAASGSYILVGSAVSGAQTTNDCLIIALSSTGTEQWRKTFGTPGVDDYCYAGLQSSQGLFFSGSANVSNGAQYLGDLWGIHTDNSGNFLGQTYYGSGDTEYQDAWAFVETPDGKITALGSNESSSTSDFLLVKMNKP